MTKGRFLGEFEQVVLLAVARQDGRGYGVSIRQEIERRTGRGVTIGSVYATLERLETKSLVESRLGDPAPVRGGRARRYFELSREGVRALAATREMMANLWDGVDLGEAGSP